MHVVLFEDASWWKMAPVSLTHAVFELTCGAGRLIDKQIRHLQPTRLTLWVRPELVQHVHDYVLPTLPIPAEINQPLDDQPTVLMNARTLLLGRYEPSAAQVVVMDDDGSVRNATVTSPGLGYDDALSNTARWQGLGSLPRDMPQGRLPTYLWEVIAWNEEAIIADFVGLPQCGDKPPTGPIHVIEPSQLCLGNDAKLGAGAVLDASGGPIIIGDGAAIGPNSFIQGPCWIGPRSTISPLSQIRSCTSIGPSCKIGGEVARAIVQANSNKAHDGFLGDSYVGEWVNLGAGTATSNLKNTYGQVSMKMGQNAVASGRQFLGSLIGSHSKTAIGTRLMTGSYIGAFCSIATASLPPTHLPSFTFLTDRGPEPFKLEKAMEIARAVNARRGKSLTAADESLFSAAQSWAAQQSL